MANFKAFVLILLFTMYQCAYSINISVIPLPSTPDSLFSKGLFGTGIIKLIHKLKAEQKNDVKELLESQLKTYSVVTDITILLADISEKIGNIKHASQVMDDVPEMISLSIILADLVALFEKIDDEYKTYLDYKASKKSANDPLLHQWAQMTRNLYHGPKDYFNTIFAKVVPKDTHRNHTDVNFGRDASILTRISKHMKGYNRICNKNKSQHQILQILYQSISITLFKIYEILEFCYRKLDEIGETNYEDEMKVLLAYVTQKDDMIKSKFQQFMHVASRAVWRCDPKTHIEDVTYSQLYNVFQKYVIHDEDVNNEHDCTKTCSSISAAKATNCGADLTNYDVETDYPETSICHQHRKCKGLLYECEDYFVNYNELWICPSSMNSTRRYEFMLHGSINWFDRRTWVGKYYGRKANKGDCERNVAYDTRGLGRTFQDPFRVCEICLCTCVALKDPNSEQTINLRPAVADKNYVVTGARIIKMHRMLNIQIEQGKLLEGGVIDVKTVHWKKVAKPTSNAEVININWRLKDVYLGVTDIANGRVVTGLKLSYIWDSNRTMLALRTLSSPYQYESGVVKSKNERWLSEMDFDYPRGPLAKPISDATRVNIENSDVPTKSEFASIAQPDTKQVIKFTTTDFEKDLGQTMIPFFDIQEVITRPPTPLSGIGFYHKNREGYGGFLGIKLLTYDHSSHLK